MAKGWKRRFDDPIPLAPRTQLVTLQDAGNYITKLPKAAHSAPEWQAATEAPDPRRNAWRADNARQDRRHDGAEPACRPRVRSQSQREALGNHQSGSAVMYLVADEPKDSVQAMMDGKP